MESLRIIFFLRGAEIAARCWPSLPQQRDRVVLCQVVGKPKAYFLVDRISYVECGTLELTYFVDLVETDVTGSVIVQT